MSDLDQKLDVWRRATQEAEPSAETMAELAALAAAASAGATMAKTAAGGVRAAVTKIVLATLMTGAVAGSVWLGYARLPQWVDALPPVAPGAPGVRTRVDIVEKRMELPPRPQPLERAIAALPHTCAGEREALLSLVDEQLGHDADAVAAALARETMLCRKLNGTGPAWRWPWKLVADCPLAKECPAGGSVNESIANAEKCLAASAKGSCERRAARVQAVFAWCERVVHDGSVRATHQQLGEQMALLEAEFGKGLAAAAWCENLQAQAEPLRMKAHAQ